MESFVDHSFTETQAYRVDGYNGHSKMTQKLGGRPGLLALASLLVAMEANDFVLTTQSNWTRPWTSCIVPLSTQDVEIARLW